MERSDVARVDQIVEFGYRLDMGRWVIDVDSVRIWTGEEREDLRSVLSREVEEKKAVAIDAGVDLSSCAGEFYHGGTKH